MTLRTIDDLTNELQFTSLALAGRTPHPEWKYSSYEQLVLEYGRPFEFTETAFPRGVEKECFANTVQALTDPDVDVRNLTRRHFFYCEGYALAARCPIAVQHAWVACDLGVAGEVTWESGDHLYYGIPFEWDYVAEIMLKTGHYGLLGNDYLNGFAFLREGIPEDAIPPRYR